LTSPALDPLSLMPAFKVCAVRIESRIRAGSTRPAAGEAPTVADARGSNASGHVDEDPRK
jgi:hypothetical protein